MATTEDFIEYIKDQMQGAGEIRYIKMFGEYAVYCGDKVVALACNNKLYVKITDAGKEYIGNPTLAPAYPGAKPSFLIEDQIEDSAWLEELIRITARNLPLPKKLTKNK